MEILFEFILELILEGSIETSKNEKIPKWIRYFLILIISLFFIGVIGLVFLAGFLVFKENAFVGIFLIGIGLFMLIASIIKFRKVYLRKNTEKTNKEL